MKLTLIHQTRKIWHHPQSWRWLLVGILLLAFALRFHRIGDSSIRWDEGWSVWVARQAPADIAAQTGQNAYPPFYFWSLHLWRSLSGDSEWGVRALSAMLGVLTVAATYLLGQTIGGRRAGLLAALILALSRFHIIWSQEVSQYAMAGFWGVLGAWAAWRVGARGKLADYVLYIFCMTAGLLTLYSFFPVVLVINLIWLWGWRLPQRGNRLGKWLAAQAIMLGLTGAWLVYVWPDLRSPVSFALPILGDFLKLYGVVLVAVVLLKVGRGRRWPLTVAFSGAIMVAAVVGMRGYYANRLLRDDYGALADALRAYVHHNDVVILTNDEDWPIFAYHYAGEWHSLDSLTSDEIAAVWQGGDGVWLVENNLAGEAPSQQNGVQPWRAGQIAGQRDMDFGETKLLFYARTPERAELLNVVVEGVEPEYELFAVVKTGMHFLGYDLPSRTYYKGDTVRMGFYFYRNWRVADESHSMEIGLTDRTGYSWDYNLTRLTPDDVTSGDGLIRKEVTFTIPSDAPSGKYSIYIFNCGGELGHFGHFMVQ